jgi:ketosteroid isomerase-like protein
MKFSKFTKLISFMVIGAVAAKSLLAGKKASPWKIALARRAVEAANAKFRDGVRLGKAVDIAGLYSDDACLLAPHQDMIQGRENIEAFWRVGLEMGIKDAVLTTVEVDVFGDRVREIGTYELKIWPEGKAAWEDSGKYLVIWRKQADGVVKLEADIWNTSVPARP